LTLLDRACNRPSAARPGRAFSFDDKFACGTPASI
jgi:hypothetical protein